VRGWPGSRPGPGARGSTRPAARLALALVVSALASAPLAAEERSLECFLLQEGGGAVTRGPDRGCDRRVTPASTFKIPHALAALDAGVLEGPDALLRWDGRDRGVPDWNRDHTLASALRHSVVWYFQEVARELGMARERAYLEKLSYGNADPSSGLTSFWLGGSLRVSPAEQLELLRRLFAGELPVSAASQRALVEMLRQPEGRVVNARGEHPFAAPWPPGTRVEAKTGRATEPDGLDVSWLVGRVRRGDRAWIFVSCVAGRALPPLAATDQAAAELARAGVLPGGAPSRSGNGEGSGRLEPALSRRSPCSESRVPSPLPRLFSPPLPPSPRSCGPSPSGWSTPATWRWATTWETGSFPPSP